MPIFVGTPGNDFLPGSSGADTLIGLAGDDVFVVDDAGDVVVEAAGEGNDVVYALVSYALTGGSEVETLAAQDNGAVTALALIGNAFANNIFGNNGANYIDGGGGADALAGFGGDDAYVVDNVADRVFEDVGRGNDIVYATASYALGGGSEIETLAAQDNSAVTALALIGNEFANTIYGNNGANYIDGNAGGDALAGFGGDDAYVVDNVADRVFEDAGRGNDIVYATASFALGGGSEIETLAAQDNSATTALALIGNEFANTIYGNNGANYIDGNSGADALAGFGGDDAYVVDNVADRVFEDVGRGNDIVYATASFALGGGSEIETLAAQDNSLTTALALIGNEFANTILGNAGANYIDGNLGADVLRGFGGDDAYVVDQAGDVVIEGAGGGNDIVYALASYTLGAGVSVETLSVTDNSAVNAIDLNGNEIANFIIGNNGANVLDGGGGNDVLRGFGGADSFAFTTTLGAGNVDTILDFQAGIDKIRLGGEAGQPFAALGSGNLRAGAFMIGTSAIQADDVIIYDSGTGGLFYDFNGSVAGGMVQFATLAAGLSLTAADFVVSGPGNNPPAVTSSGTASVPENSAASTIVYQTIATDPDGDTITYSLTGADASLLTIDAGGAVRLVSSADFETKALYQFNVVVSDSGLSTTRAVSLTITDVADVSTPIINEAPGENGATGNAQVIDRNIFTIANNPNLPDDDLPSGTIHGDVSSTGDKDFFSITLQAGERLILDVDGTLDAGNPAGSLDPHLRIYDPNGTELLDNDDQQSFDPGSVPTIASHNTDSFISFRAPTSGTYYFSIEAFGGLSDGAYQINVSVGPPATAAQLLDEDIDAMISGSEWNHTDLTYGFPTLASQYPPGIEETDNGGPPLFNDPDNFEPFSALQQGAVTQQLGLIAQVSGLTFQLLAGNPGAADLRYAMSDEAEVAYAYYPTNGGSSSLGGTAWFNNSDTKFDNPAKGNYAWMGILHETGHALGLKHGHEAPAISTDRDSLEYTVMTYRSYPGDPIENGYSNEQFGYPQSLMILDIAALQRVYGANFNTNAGNSVYSWTPSAGQTFINGAGQGQIGDGVSQSANRIFLTIWDGGGTDTYDLSAYATATLIDLRPGEWTTTGIPQIANLGGGQSARGNIANAVLFEGNTQSLIENAVGGSAGDTIIANQAANNLTGGAGADVFTWKAGTDAGVGAAADTIADFLSGSDKIRLSDIDAIPGTGADDAFTFIGTNAFSNAPGQLRYQVEGGNLRVQADIDGNGVADMEIIVNNLPILAASDFFL